MLRAIKNQGATGRLFLISIGVLALGCNDSQSGGGAADADLPGPDRGEIRIVVDASIGDTAVDGGTPDGSADPDGSIRDACPNPMEESCNGADDDCDGRIDEDFNVAEPCTVGLGQCERTGELACVSETEAACNAEAGNGSTEYCNDLDDDCDGRSDESYEDLGFACDITEGACTSSGRVVCAEGGLSTRCDAAPIVPSDELCDGADNDCDGNTDEGIDVGGLCEAGVGLCRRGGFVECGENGEVLCTAMPGPPADEACDGFDNDCDGLPDEDFGGGVCTAGTGGCEREGFIACNEAGELVCNAVAGEPNFETCNAIDDDCDGTADERWPELGEACTAGEGVCQREGVVACTEADEGGLQFEGVRQNLEIADLEAGGFELCWSGDFSGSAQIAEVLARCNQDVLLMGCRPNAQVDRLSIAAMGERAEVLTDVGPGVNATHQHNGVGWYFHESRSWGFAPGDMPVSRNSCDTNAMEPALRMCWHTSNGRITSGYRCGEPRNGVRNTLRVIYHRPAGPTAECSAVAGEPEGDEVCNGSDDDCDGATDEEIMGVGDACELDGLALCEIAVTQCTEEGEVACLAQAVAPVAETCNARDDDCDGTVDEDFPQLGDECAEGIGTCRNEGTYVCSGDGERPGGLAFEGVRQNVPEAELLAGGFEACWTGRFGGQAAIEEILEGCGEGEWVMACRPVGQAALTVAATGARDEILTDVGPGQAATHEHNGVSWYFNGSRSWGFAAGGTGVSRNSCDTSAVQPESRMCWHTSNNRVTSGYRCGRTTTNGNNNWERIIYQRSEGGRAVCSVGSGEPAEVELCNTLDDDCDGTTDEEVDGTGELCELEGLEVCQRPETQCNEEGELVCRAVQVEAQPEACNAFDDDCDGQTDEDFPELGEACSDGVGACETQGTFVCDGAGGRGGGLAFEGVRQNVPEAELTGVGFEQCWAGRFNQTSPIADILEGCGEEEWVMACRQAGQPAFTIAATGARAEILTDVGPGAQATHEHNGVSWYFNGSRSWGFAAEGTGVSRNSCDTGQVQPELRMCWHTNANRVTSGYRCGRTTLNGNNQWERVILQRAPGGRMICDAVADEPAEVEECNGSDDDCDGSTDEGVEGAGEWCDLDGLAVCHRGQIMCNEDGVLMCTDVEVEPEVEACNGRDDDCDGTVDEAFPELGELCAVGEGVCRREGMIVCGGGPGHQAGLAFEGIRQNVPVAEIEAAGFELCWSGLYNGSEPMADVLGGCGEGELLLACRPNNAPNLTLAATGERAEVLTDLGRERNAVHNHNGVDWYFNDSYSMGFLAPGTGVNRSSCDTANAQPEFRMCWHSSNGRITSGYRCGATFLNGNAGWQRLIYQRTPGAIAVCSVEAGEPAGDEACNDLDDDCDGLVDEGLECPDLADDAGVPAADAGLAPADAAGMADDAPDAGE